MTEHVKIINAYMCESAEWVYGWWMDGCSQSMSGELIHNFLEEDLEAKLRTPWGQ